MTNRRKVKIKDIFLGLQNQMCSRLFLNREILPHPVSKGDASELEWVDMLATYLPKRYQVEKAFVIDYTGRISDQIDIIIFDRQYSPFLLRQNGATYIPAESVYAVIEAKPNLNLNSLRYAANKAASVRRLKRTSAPIVEARGKIGKPKPPFDIFAGILTLEGSLNNRQEKELKKLAPEKFLNFGCSLSKGAFYIEKETLDIEKSDKNYGLVFFFIKLFSSLQLVGTVPAIDIKKYIKHLK